MITSAQHSQPEHTQGQAAVKGYTEQSSFAFGVAMAARNLQTKADLERILSLAPKVCVSKLSVEGSCYPLWHLPDGGMAKSGTWKPPRSKVTSNWLKLLLDGM